MSLPLLIALLSIVSFGSAVFYYYTALETTRRKLRKLESENKRKAFEEQLLEEIHETLDYSLDTEKATTVIVKHLTSLFSCSTITTVLVSGHNLKFSTHAVDSVPHSYIDAVRESILDQLMLLENRSFRDAVITENRTGTVSEHTIKPAIASIMHAPLKLHHNVTAIITITSIHADAFPQGWVDTLQHILKLTTKSLNRLDSALKTEKGKLSAMISSLSDGIFMIDTKNNLQIINPAAKQMLALHKDDLTTMDVLSALPVSYDFKGKIEAAMHHDQHQELGEITMRNKLYSFSITPVRSTTGILLGVSVLMRDSTLKNAVPRMKEDFTNIIVHELRSPLTSIKASSELLISPVAFSKAEQARLHHLIYQQSNKLLTDVQQILDAAKLEASVFTIHKQQADLKQVIKDATAQFTPEAQRKLLNFIVDIDPHLSSFSFDPKYITQAITNVLANSMKFTSTGGTIQVNAKQKQGNVVITIADTGAGIPKDKQHIVFTKFGQLAEGSANVGKGLGLYLVKGIIESHGGSVTIDSDTGRGTTIFLTLPMTDAAQHAPQNINTHPINSKMVN